MGGYIANFTVYTMAMTGLICFAVFIYKKFMDGSIRGDNTKFLSVEESMSLTPRKTLHVVRAGNEKFLIASDVDRTTLISKLANSEKRIPAPDFENFDRFKNIEQENFNQNMIQDLNQVYPPSPAAQEFQTPVQKTKQTIHLEPIKSKNPNSPHLRKGMDTGAGRNSYINKKKNSTAVDNKNVVLDFEKPASHGFSTMKEMAKKINEL